jgi:trimethylamine--corrinoid protein Co-methyltransferase
LAGADVIFGGGTFDSANTYSLDQLVIDDEMCGAMLRVARGFKTSDEQLAVGLIKKVGIGGHFLAESHTLKHGKAERWFPSLYKRMKKTEVGWSLATMGRHDLAAAAKNKVDEILRTHKPQPLNRETQQALNDIVAKTERQAITQEKSL